MADSSDVDDRLAKTAVSKCKRHCSVPQCTAAAWKDHNLSFHRFPNAWETCRRGPDVVNRRDEWVRVLRIGKSVTETMPVCSLHFTSSDYTLPGKSVPTCVALRYPGTASPGSKNQCSDKRIDRDKR